MEVEAQRLIIHVSSLALEASMACEAHDVFLAKQRSMQREGRGPKKPEGKLQEQAERRIRQQEEAEQQRPQQLQAEELQRLLQLQAEEDQAEENGRRLERWGEGLTSTLAAQWAENYKVLHRESKMAEKATELARRRYEEHIAKEGLSTTLLLPRATKRRPARRWTGSPSASREEVEEQPEPPSDSSADSASSIDGNWLLAWAGGRSHAEQFRQLVRAKMLRENLSKAGRDEGGCSRGQ